MNKFLLVSNPPHPNVDAQVAAAVLGIPPSDANLKVRYGIPEIWVAENERSMIEADAADLRDAGMRCEIITGEHLVGVPSQTIVRSVAFSDGGIVLRTDDGERTVRFDKPMIVLPILPRAAEGVPQGTRVTVAPSVQVSDISPVLDMHLPDGDRFALYAELVDFDGLEETMRERFRRARFDDRLKNMQLRRPRQMLPSNMREARRGYSYASPGLEGLLNQIEPGLVDMSQSELSARLTFLTTLASMAGGA